MMQTIVVGIGLSVMLAGCATRKEGRQEWHGDWSQIAGPFATLISTEANWKDLRNRMFGGLEGAPVPPPVDFEREMVLVISEGDFGPCRGIIPDGVWEEADRLLVRVRHLHTLFSSTDGSPFESVTTPSKSRLQRPYGLIVLARVEAKPVVVEVNQQTCRESPPIWKERHRLTLAQDPARELDAVPR
jgi:hypothetical protein